MKAKLRPHRDTKVKFQTKTKSINLKAKEKLPAKKKNKVKEKPLPNKSKIKSEIVTPPKELKLKRLPLIQNKPKRVYKKKDTLSPKVESIVSDDKLTKSISTNGITETPKKVQLEVKNGKKVSESAALKPRHHKCDTCGKAFLGKNDLRKHSLIHTGLRPHVCSHCQKEFRQAGNLKNHISSYHSNVIENPIVFICEHCKKTFLIKERLRLHMRIHTGQKPYNCESCNMRFARMGQLKQHVRTHTGEKNFSCVHCQATFTCGAKLRLHIKGHFDIRDYTCYLCGKRFIRADAIKKHLACFHNGEKPFKCPLCKKSLKGHLQEHLRTHRAEKPHGCAECGSCFAQRSQLTVHQRKHSGARPYRCRVCWKAFAHSTALTLHTRHHTGEKPFKCRICSAPFAQLPHMKKHMLFVHGDGRAYCHQACGSVFNTKSELELHLLQCDSEPLGSDMSPEEQLSQQIADAYRPVEPPMALTKMRLLLAVLLKKISSSKRLQKLGLYNFTDYGLQICVPFCLFVSVSSVLNDLFRSK